MLPQSLRVRPWNALALPPQRVNDKVCAIGAEIGFRPGIRSFRQFAAPEKIRQTKLLGNGRAKTAANESPQFHHGRFANFSIDHSPRSQMHRATVQLWIEQ